MDHSSDRKRWSPVSGKLQLPLNLAAAQDDVPPQYEHYLHLLQERNRLMKKLQQKDKKEIELEKKEKGFTLYLNSSFSGQSHSSSKNSSRNQNHRSPNPASHLSQNVRKSTSQGKEKRKNWNIGSVEFTTAGGHRHRVKAPDHLSGKYADDFDSSSGSEDSDSSDVVYSMSSLNIDDSISLTSSHRQKTSYLKRVAAAKKEETQSENRLTIKLEDVKKLRESLQLNKAIRHSVAMEPDSEVEEDITEAIVQGGSDDERVSPVGEEIQEDISSEDDTRKMDESVPKPLRLLKPGSTLVLEFQPLTPAKSVSKVSRPLSANLRSFDTKVDTREETSAVLKALQEENKKVEVFSKTTSYKLAAPPQSKAVSPRPLPSPAKEVHKLTPLVKSSSDPDQNQPVRPLPSRKTQSSVEADPNINNVIERVLKLNPRQQKQLLQTLNCLDVDDKSLVLSKSLNAMANSWTSSAPVTDHFEVGLELRSNWGHSSHVGLTELEFFDQSGCLIPIKPSDVSVRGARGSTNKVDVLFNGKSKTTKERNMWSCKFDGRPVEFSISMVNPNPGKQFQLGSVKVWNWNHKISNLDMGAREIRITCGDELLFAGEVEKGCGNQVFDYSQRINLTKSDSADSTEGRRLPSRSGLALNLEDTSRSVTVSPRMGQPLANLTSPTMTQNSSAKENSQTGSMTSQSHHTFRSISRSSQSSASSSGSVTVKTNGEDGADEEKLHFRSETRTLTHPALLNKDPSPLAGQSSPEVRTGSANLSALPEKKSSQAPVKSSRVAARLSGTQADAGSSSESVTDSNKGKPPLSLSQKSEDRTKVSSKSVERSLEVAAKSRPSPVSSRSEPHMSPSQPSTSVSDSRVNTSALHTSRADTFHLPVTTVDSSQNKSMENDRDKPSLIDKIKAMNDSESRRKKELPKWLKGDEKTTDSASAGKVSTSFTRCTKGTMEENTLHKQLDEELDRFSRAGNMKSPVTSLAEEDDDLVPLKQMGKARAKWRHREENLEESWGSLSFFNQSHKGRVSIDTAEGDLDEYLSFSMKKRPDATGPSPKVPLPADSWSDDDLEFTIPELPCGKELIINIKTTWGDHHYVGLTGVELFSSLGEKVSVTKIWASPSDINILPEYHKDPRVVTNLIDQVNRTRDDVHMWLAPFSPGNNHLIYMTLAKPCKLAVMRIWNYNKSRIHSYRGAKDVIITLDGTEIFKGEIARACGGVEGGTEAFGDTILFTTDESILEAVSKSDDAFLHDLPREDQEDVPFERPSTAHAEDDTRPFTRAAGKIEPEKSKTVSPSSGLHFVTSVGDVLVYKADNLQLNFTSTWGDLHYLGLTGLEVVGGEGESLPLQLSMFAASPRDLRHLPGNENDDRTLDKLLDGVNVSCSDSHMWLIPFTKGGDHTVTITFPQQTLVTGVRIWNYNKSPEDTYRGAKVMHAQINGRTVSPPEGYLLRKGPGVCHFDFAQEISFTSTGQPQKLGNQIEGFPGSKDQKSDSSSQLPRGFIFQLQLFSTWGDQYYIGLNGLEFYDSSLNKIELTESNIAAFPDSINVLDNGSHDTRTPDKLIDGWNDTNDGRHMWLAPILPSVTNRIYVIFDQPTSVSMIKLWNYSKTVSRGVKDFALLVDDLLVYNGCLQAVSGGAIGILPTCSASIPHHTILFTDNQEAVCKEKNFIISNQNEDQDIQLLNDKKIVSKFAKSTPGKPVNQALRPKTSVTTAKAMNR